MKLLSSKEINTLKQKEHEALVIKGVKISTLVDKEIRKLNELQTNYRTETQKLERDFAELKEKIGKQSASLLNEIALLEARKAEALKPLTDKENKLNGLDTLLTIRANALGDRENEIRVRDLASQSSREESVMIYGEAIARERQADKKITMADERERQAKKSVEEAAKKLLEINNEYVQTVHKMAEEKETIAIEKEKIRAERAVINDRMKQLAIDERRITDKYQTLLSATEEIKQLKSK